MYDENKVKVSLLLFYLLVTLCQTKILLGIFFLIKKG